MFENFQGDSWGSILPLRMSSLLLNDLCHGWRSSRRLPALQLPHWVALSTLSIMKPVHLPYSLKCFFFFSFNEIWDLTWNFELLPVTDRTNILCHVWLVLYHLLTSQDSFPVPSTSPQFQSSLSTWLFPLSDPWWHGKWRLKKISPPKKKLEWENQGFWGLRIRMPDIIVSASSLCHRRWPYSVIYMKREHCWVFQVQ